jgi:exodeoxyribonuclease VII large subunit
MRQGVHNRFIMIDSSKQIHPVEWGIFHQAEEVMKHNPTVDSHSQCGYSTDMQPELFDGIARYTVSSLTRRLRSLIEGDEGMQDIWVEGEISNHSRPASGHVYFTLKDAGAQLRCVMWRSDAARLKITLQDGMLVEAHGSLGLYETGGQYQLYTNILRPLGEGALYAEFLRLKEMLEAEGLFAPERKKEIPELPKKIGIVTSPTGAALQDMLDTLRRRYPLAEVILSPTPVQGEAAPEAIVDALEKINRLEEPDVILLARGGGSMEDLWAFNDERVVRAVVGSQAPVITGVGHETDFTLADFAADLRAPTPTAAAELATRITREDLLLELNQMERDQANEMEAYTHQLREHLSMVEDRLRLLSPMRRVLNESQRLDEVQRRLIGTGQQWLSLRKARVESMQRRLYTLDPMAVLQRGYAVVQRKRDGLTVGRKSLVQPGDDLRVRVSDGDFDAQVTGE